MAASAATTTRGDSEERILRAALAAFSEHGFEGATTREIASRAGVTLGLLQYYFGGKLKLWQAAVDRAFAELDARAQSTLDDEQPADTRERLRLVIRNHVAFVAERPEFVRLMHDEGKRRGPRMRWLVDRHVKPMWDTMTPLLKQAQREGLLPGDIDPVHFIYILVGSVGIFFHQAEECKRLAGFDPADRAEAHARAVEHLFLGPLTQENSA